MTLTQAPNQVDLVTRQIATTRRKYADTKLAYMRLRVRYLRSVRDRLIINGRG